MDRSLKIAIATVLALTLAVASFAGGVLFERLTPLDVPFPDIERDRSSVVEAVEQVEDILDGRALEPTPDTSMTAGAIRGMLDSLDDSYAAYFDERHYEYFAEQTEGEFYGIGVTITDRDGEVVVVSPIEGTPAAEAGLEADDVIVSVDGVTPEEWDTSQAVQLIRGPEGTDVTLGIRRSGTEGILEFTITRAQIDIPNTTSELRAGDVGYIRLMTFNTKSEDDLRDAVEALEAEGARSLVLDLRDNPGGLLDSAVEVASLFIDEGLVVTVEAREGPVEEHRATGRSVTDLSLVVLVNEYSASASEIVAGALRDHERATLVGETTFGKGSVQTVEEIRAGGAIKFTIAHYLTPNGDRINKVGLGPDVRVEMDPMLQADEDEDVQLQRAIEVAQPLRG
jgi:carboxyl-terminal processing protease